MSTSILTADLPGSDPQHGITCIDTLQERPLMACAYLLAREGEAAFIETGTAHSVPRLLAQLDAQGIARRQVRYVIPTHVHLDHASGAGLLMQALPNAQLVVHPRGARHLIDPSKLIAGASAVYGADYVAQMYGQIVPVDAGRVIVADDGTRVPFAGGELAFIDTPGHARHHFAVWDAASRGIFSGDTLGLSYREFDTAAGPFVMLTSSPVQFDADALRATIDRLLAYQPQRVFFTHYGVAGDVPRLAQDLRDNITRYERIGAALRTHPQRHAALVAALREDALQALRAHGCTLDESQIDTVLATDFELNAQGLEIWLDGQPA